MQYSTPGSGLPTTPRTITVILNPAAGNGKAGRVAERLSQQIQTAASAPGAECTILRTTRSGQAEQMARDAAASGADIVAAAGGDGTLHEVLNGVYGTQARLGVLPIGTGNDFARMADIPRTVEGMVSVLLTGTERRVDLGRVGDRLFINVAGCGLDSAVAVRMQQSSRILGGTPAYIAATLRTVASWRPVQFSITVDGANVTAAGTLCAVANSQWYGGGMRIAPDADITDGLLDVCFIGNAGRLELVLAFPRVFAGSHVSHPAVTMLRGRTVRIETDPPQPWLADGEVLGSTPVEFTVEAMAIGVVVPAPNLDLAHRSENDP